MEPLGLPEPDAEDPLRAIVLTPASQNTAARSIVAETQAGSITTYADRDIEFHVIQ